MSRVIVEEMCDQTDMGTGEHVWIDIVFNSGQTVTLRLDEKDLHVRRPRLFARVDDEIGKEIVL